MLGRGRFREGFWLRQWSVGSIEWWHLPDCKLLGSRVGGEGLALICRAGRRQRIHLPKSLAPQH